MERGTDPRLLHDADQIFKISVPDSPPIFFLDIILPFNYRFLRTHYCKLKLYFPTHGGNHESRMLYRNRNSFYRQRC